MILQLHFPRRNFRGIFESGCCHFSYTLPACFLLLMFFSFLQAHTRDATWPNCSHVTSNSLQMSKSCNPTEQSYEGTQYLCTTCGVLANPIWYMATVSWLQNTVGGVRRPQCAVGAPLSCYLFFSLQRLHLRGRGAWRPSFGRKKRKQMASRRRRGQRGVRLRLRPNNRCITALFGK